MIGVVIGVETEFRILVVGKQGEYGVSGPLKVSTSETKQRGSAHHSLLP